MSPTRSLLLALILALPLAACGERSPGDDSADASAATEDLDWTLRSERSGFVETATHDEVLRYLEQAAARNPALHLTHFGYTNEGRALPLLIAGDGLDLDPETEPWNPAGGPDPRAGSAASAPRVIASADEALARAVRQAADESKRPIIYLQGGIHSGEAAGKEGLLRLVRALAQGERPELLSELVLLIGPIYNADGNERRGLGNRPRQHGPLAGMGTRANAQGLDLNRDQMKLDSPEGRSLAGLMNTFDPHVLVDLHTTNGTRHAYHLTYSPPLHPATPSAIDDLLRDELLPAVTASVEEEFGWYFWHYGNVSTREGVQGWYTFDHRPRFVTNYTGLRNRIGILSEAYSYATFRDRILASERFVDGILAWSRANAAQIRAVVAAEDARDLRGTRIPVRAGFPDTAPEHPILMGEVVEETNPWSGDIVFRRLDVVDQDPMPAHVAFTGTEDEVVPNAYLIPTDLEVVIGRLRAHGVRVRPAAGGDAPAAAGIEGTTQRFMIDGVERAAEPFQGRTEVTLEGAWEAADDVAPGTGWVVVPMDQPLARLAFLLLEPRADDGLANWGLLDDRLEEGAPYPVLRVVPGS